MPDGSVFPGAIHSLEDQQQCMLIGCVVKILQRAQLLHVLVKKFLVLLIRFAIRIDNRRPFAEIDLFRRRYAENL
jgi:hypothetical protein